MKPRTAVASFILAAVTSALANQTALADHGQRHKRKSHKRVTAKQMARLNAIAAFYTDEITKTLRNVAFEGDTAEVGTSAHDVNTTGEAVEPTDTDASYAAADNSFADTVDAALDDTTGEALKDEPDVGADFDPLGFGRIFAVPVGGSHAPSISIGKLVININPTAA